jgi:hypothetical protein
MRSLELDLYQKRLRKYVSAAPFAPFARMIWAVDAIQSERVAGGSKHIRFPKEAATTDPLSQYKVHGWDLEDLWGEYFATRHKRLRKDGRNKLLNCTHWDTFCNVMNALKGMQNAESGIILRDANVLHEMPKIMYRQLDWQRGFFTTQNFYRTAFLFGGPLAQEHFLKTVGVSFEQYTKTVFALYAHFRERPISRKQINAKPIGVSSEELALVIDHISATPRQITDIARALKVQYPFASQRPSVLRRAPIIQMGRNNDLICCPLIDVLAWRITEGLYYDTVGDNGALRNEISGRFEEYCKLLLDAQTKSFEIVGEYLYRISKKRELRTPDILLRENGSLRVVLECKQRRMSFDAVFEPKNNENEVPGIEEIIKGVFQLWRFFSHVRRGFAKNEKLSDSVVGVVLTLDPWLVMTRGRYEHILAEARKMAHEQEPAIEDQDMRDVAFCYVRDWESLLVRASDATLLSTFGTAASDEFAGWLLQSVHENQFPEQNERKPFPFKEQLGEVLPWWDKNKDELRT